MLDVGYLSSFVVKGARFKAADVGIGFGDACICFFQQCGLEIVIAVKENDAITYRLTQTEVSCGTGKGMLLLESEYVGMLGCVLLGKLESSVCGSVIYDEELEGIERLLSD